MQSTSACREKTAIALAKIFGLRELVRCCNSASDQEPPDWLLLAEMEAIAKRSEKSFEPLKKDTDKMKALLGPTYTRKLTKDCEAHSLPFRPDAASRTISKRMRAELENEGMRRLVSSRVVVVSQVLGTKYKPLKAFNAAGTDLVLAPVFLLSSILRRACFFVLQQRRSISTGLASSQSSSRKATRTPDRKATQTRTCICVA